MRKGLVMEVLRKITWNGEATWVNQRGKLLSPVGPKAQGQGAVTKTQCD